MHYLSAIIDSADVIHARLRSLTPISRMKRYLNPLCTYDLCKDPVKRQGDTRY